MDKKSFLMRVIGFTRVFICGILFIALCNVGSRLSEKKAVMHTSINHPEYFTFLIDIGGDWNSPAILPVFWPLPLTWLDGKESPLELARFHALSKQGDSDRVRNQQEVLDDEHLLYYLPAVSRFQKIDANANYDGGCRWPENLRFFQLDEKFPGWKFFAAEGAGQIVKYAGDVMVNYDIKRLPDGRMRVVVRDSIEDGFASHLGLVSVYDIDRDNRIYPVSTRFRGPEDMYSDLWVVFVSGVLVFFVNRFIISVAVRKMVL